MNSMAARLAAKFLPLALRKDSSFAGDFDSNPVSPPQCSEAISFSGQEMSLEWVAIA
jgi:hypothetical protein